MSDYLPHNYKEESNQVTFSLDTHLHSKQFPPHSKHFGHLYKGPIITAHNKNSLGSIPSSIETILFSKPSQLPPHHHLGIFSPSGNNSLKVSFLTSNIPSKPLSRNLSPKPSKKKSKQPSPLRFDYSTLENSKYLPGPCEYSPRLTPTNHPRNIKSTNQFGTGRNDNSINSMYYNIKEMNMLGPGSYDISDSLKKKNGYCFSKHDRFKDHKIDNYISRVGPGLYDVRSSFGNGSNKTSFFFKKEKMRKSNEKDNGNENGSGLGPGCYNLEREFDKKEKIKVKKSFGDIRKEVIVEGRWEGNKGMDDMENIIEKKYDGYEKEERMKDKGNRYGCVMNSKSPRFKNFGNVSTEIMHVPGPCYYKPVKYDKKSFNCNIHSNWI